MAQVVHLENSEAAKKAKAEYMRAWRKKNKDKVAATQWRYWERKALEAEIKGKGEADE